MAELIKSWPNGGSLTVTYNGVGDGDAVFSSEQNTGIDRETEVIFKGGGMEEVRKVTQAGLRQPFGFADGGVFRVKDDGRFGVLKEK